MKMKKAIALLVVLAFVVALAGISSAATPAQIRAYIGQLNKKLAVAQKSNDTARVAKLKVLLNEQKGKLAEAEGVAPPPPVAVPPPPPPAKIAPSAGGALFGWGLKTAGSLGYVMNKSVLAVRGDALLPDPLGLGPIVGLPADSVMYKVGLGYITGKDNTDLDFRAVPLYVDGVIMLPADVLGGIESYLGGGVNYLLSRTGKTSGSIGGQIYYGILGDLGLGAGKAFGQVGYSILRTGDKDYPRSAKGITAELGYSLVL